MLFDPVLGFMFKARMKFLKIYVSGKTIFTIITNGFIYLMAKGYIQAWCMQTYFLNSMLALNVRFLIINKT